MAQGARRAQRLDPYENYKLRFRAGSATHPGSELTYRHASPKQSKYDSILVDRGVTQNLTFSAWASRVAIRGATPVEETSLDNYRKNIYLELYDEAEMLVVTYKICGPWISEFPARPLGEIVVHCLELEGIQEQLAAILEKSLRRLRPRGRASAARESQ